MRAILVAFVLASAARAEDKVFSGPQPGEKLPALKVVGVHDDDEGKEHDFVKEANGKPTVIVFVHEITRPSASLIRGLSAYAASREKDGLKTYLVWLSRDRTETTAWLKRARQSLALKSPVGISVDGIEGPGAYGLNRKVGLTILVAKEGKVTANFALTQPAITDGPPLTEAIVKLVGGKALDVDQFESLVRGRRPDAPPDERDPKLVALMRRMINLQATPDDVKKAAEEVEKFAGTDRKKWRQVGEIAAVVVKQKYGTEEAQKQMKVWADKYTPKRD